MSPALFDDFYTAVSRRDTLKTLSGGFVLMVCLHFIIKVEQIKEHGDLGSLFIPVEHGFVPLGLGDENKLHNPEKLENGKFRIPKIIHQTWKNIEVPARFVPWIKSWIKNHPDWKYMLWTDGKARKLIEERYPKLLETYDSYGEHIRRVDALKYVILHEFGGVYVDMDLENIKPIDPLMKTYSCFLGQEPYEHSILDGNFETLAINAIMACRPKHPFMKMLIDNLESFKHMYNVLDSTGPHYLTFIYNQYTKLRHLPASHYNGTYITPAGFFSPTIDPSKFFWIRRQCAKFYKLSKLQQKACKTLKVLGLKRKPSTEAFGNHHEIHSYFEFGVSLKGPTNIKKIVPNVEMYKTKDSIP